MKSLASLVFLCLLIQLPSCIREPCEAAEQYLSTIAFSIMDGPSSVFNTKDERNTLEVISIEKQKPADFRFNILDQDTLSSFYISDEAYDNIARERLLCPSYVVKYGVDEIDTLKICYRIRPRECGDLQLDSVKIFWNGVAVSYDAYYTANLPKP